MTDTGSLHRAPVAAPLVPWEMVLKAQSEAGLIDLREWGGSEGGGGGQWGWGGSGPPPPPELVLIC